MRETVKAVAYGVRPERDRLVLFPTRAKARKYAEAVASEQRQAVAVVSIHAPVAVERLTAEKELLWLGGSMWHDGVRLDKSNYLRAYRKEFEEATPQIVLTVPYTGTKN